MYTKDKGRRSGRAGTWASWTLLGLSACAGTSDDAPIAYSQLSTADELLLAADASVSPGVCDWENLTTIAELPQDSRAIVLSSIGAKTTEDALCVEIRGLDLAGRGYNLFLDADGDPNNNLKTAHYWTDDGSDFVLDHWGNLFPFSGPGWNPGTLRATIRPEPDATPNPTRLRFRIPFDALGVTTTPPAGFGIGFESLKRSAIDVSDVLPKRPFKARIGDTSDQSCPPVTGPHAPHTPQCSFDPTGRTKIPVRQGVLMPAYFPPDNPNWSAVHAAATALKGSGKDFWVAVNPASGPYANGAPEWAAAKNAWQPVKANGGAVFGYVHTCKSKENADGTFVCPGELRGLGEVQEEISRWVCNYPDVDGIWLDEFYPRYEVAAGDDDAKPESPNPTVAPIDPNYRRPGLTVAEFKTLNIGPKCGYYDRLRQWIQDTYPHLTVIANAGGSLRSNQRRYGDLFDVLVSFEQSAYLAETGALEAQRDIVSLANAALIHGGLLSSLSELNEQMEFKIPKKTRSELIDTAFRLGYSHIYATDRMYDANPWKAVPVDSLGSSLRAVPSADGKWELAPEVSASDFAGLRGQVDFIKNWKP